jgi:hypothetical protein
MLENRTEVLALLGHALLSDGDLTPSTDLPTGRPLPRSDDEPRNQLSSQRPNRIPVGSDQIRRLPHPIARLP